MNTPKPHRRGHLRRFAILGLCTALITVAFPLGGASAEPVSVHTGEIIGTAGLGHGEHGDVQARSICPGSSALVGITAYRVDNESAEPITGIVPTCATLSADNGVVSVTNPQPHYGGVLGDADQGSVGASDCQDGSIVTGARGAVTGSEIFGVQLRCSFLLADGSLLPAPDATTAFADPDGTTPPIACQHGAAAVGANALVSPYYTDLSLHLFALECATLSFPGQPRAAISWAPTPSPTPHPTVCRPRLRRR